MDALKQSIRNLLDVHDINAVLKRLGDECGIRGENIRSLAGPCADWTAAANDIYAAAKLIKARDDAYYGTDED